MRSTLRDLLSLAIVIAALGCRDSSRIQQLQRGAEDIDRHAKAIQAEAQLPDDKGTAGHP